MTKIYFPYRRCLLLGLLLCGNLLLSACHTAKPFSDKNDTPAASLVNQPPAEAHSGSMETSKSAAESERRSPQMVLCQKEMEALKQISPRQHHLYQQEFSRLMRSTVQYAGIRTQVNSNTQETVDALYHYKAKRLCTNISQALLNGLAEMAESIK